MSAPSSRLFRIAVLISGRGSNMLSIQQACLERAWPAQVVVVGSNKGDAAGLALAANQGIPTFSLDPKNYGDRVAYDQALADALDQYEPDLVVLAGYMRLLSEGFVQRFAGRLINIHPSLLPMFPGLNTHQQALDAGVQIHGCTVHYVTPLLDQGPIIAQAWVPVQSNDTSDTLASRVLRCEHPLYVQCVEWIVYQKTTVQDGRVQIQGNPPRLFTV